MSWIFPDCSVLGSLQYYILFVSWDLWYCLLGHKLLDLELLFSFQNKKKLYDLEYIVTHRQCVFCAVLWQLLLNFLYSLETVQGHSLKRTKWYCTFCFCCICFEEVQVLLTMMPYASISLSRADCRNESSCSVFHMKVGLVLICPFVGFLWCSW